MTSASHRTKPSRNEIPGLEYSRHSQEDRAPSTCSGASELVKVPTILSLHPIASLTSLTKYMYFARARHLPYHISRNGISCRVVFAPSEDEPTSELTDKEHAPLISGNILKAAPDVGRGQKPSFTQNEQRKHSSESFFFDVR